MGYICVPRNLRIAQRNLRILKNGTMHSARTFLKLSLVASKSLLAQVVCRLVLTFVTVSRKRMRSAQNLECEFYISADSVKRAL